MKVAIMTDTNSGLSPEAGARLGVFVLPMPVVIDDVCYMEGQNKSYSELFAAMRSGKEVHSAQPSPGELTEMWTEILAQGYDSLVYIPMSSGLSGSCTTARKFAEEFDGRVLVADNHRISVTLYESVRDAKLFADAGMSADEICRKIEELGSKSSIYITVNSLEYLKKSGRVTAAGAMIATVLNLKPVLTIQGEKLDAFAKERGMKRAMDRMTQAVAEDRKNRFGGIPDEKIRIGIAGAFEDMELQKAWIKTVEEAFPGYETYYMPLSCSVASHVGIDSAGIGICYASDIE